MIGAVGIGIAQRDAAGAEIGSCAAYSGLPSGDSETAGMAFIPGGTFRMGAAPIKITGFSSFITTKAAAYCFLPSITAIKFISKAG
jgi:hypothetical protein